MKNRATLLLLAGLALAALAMVMDFLSGTAQGPSYFFWLTMASMLTTLVLYPFVANNQLSGWPLMLATFGILYVVGNVSISIEAYIFNVTDFNVTMGSVLKGIPYALAVSWVLTRLLSSKPSVAEPRVPRSIGAWIGKVLAGNFLYFVFYFSAGLILQQSYPPLMEYYSDKIPPLMTIITTNLFIRGFLFVAVAVTIDRYCTLSSWQKAVTTGAIFAVLGGIAPLLIPSELMPQHIRIAHGFEVGISNFLYGVVLHRILRRRPAADNQPAKAGLSYQSKAVAS